MSVRRRHAPLVAGLALVAGLSSCSGNQEAGGPTASPSPTVTPVSGRDLEGVSLRRTSFCGDLPEGAPDRAVGGQVKDTVEYASGDRVEVAPGTTDIAHEYSCGYTSSGRAAARAWVFAPAVTPAQARDFAKAARSPRACRPLPGAAVLGDRAVGLVCTDHGVVTVSSRALVGDTWLSCEVAAPDAPRDELVSRLDEWCGAVVDALSA